MCRAVGSTSLSMAVETESGAVAQRLDVSFGTDIQFPTSIVLPLKPFVLVDLPSSAPRSLLQHYVEQYR